MSCAIPIIVTLLGISALLTLGLCMAASAADDALRNMESRRAMPDGSRVDEANIDAGRTLPDRSATTREEQ